MPRRRLDRRRFSPHQPTRTATPSAIGALATARESGVSHLARHRARAACAAGRRRRPPSWAPRVLAPGVLGGAIWPCTAPASSADRLVIAYPTLPSDREGVGGGRAVRADRDVDAVAVTHMHAAISASAATVVLTEVCGGRAAEPGQRPSCWPPSRACTGSRPDSCRPSRTRRTDVSVRTAPGWWCRRRPRRWTLPARDGALGEPSMTDVHLRPSKLRRCPREAAGLLLLC